MRRVRCVDTGEVFKSITEAARHYDLDGSDISRCCRYKTGTCGGKRWEYIDKPITPKRQSFRTYKKRVRCVDTGEVFESITEAANRYNISVGNICKCCTGYLDTTAGMQWEYVDKVVPIGNNDIEREIGLINTIIEEAVCHGADSGYGSYRENKVKLLESIKTWLKFRDLGDLYEIIEFDDYDVWCEFEIVKKGFEDERVIGRF